MHFARNVQFQIKAGKNEEFTRILNEQVLPLLKQQKGFKDELMLVNRDRVMGISLWADRPSAEAYHTTGYTKVLEKLTPVIEGTPKVDTFEVPVTTLRG